MTKQTLGIGETAAHAVDEGALAVVLSVRDQHGELRSVVLDLREQAPRLAARDRGSAFASLAAIKRGVVLVRESTPSVL